MSRVVTIDIKKLPEALRRNEMAVRDAIAKGAMAGAQRGRNIMIRVTPTDQGQLRASWKVLRRVSGARNMPAGETSVVELRNDAPHAGLVELGCRPHGMSPAGWAALYEWVRRHPELYTGSGSASNPDQQGPNPLRMRRARAARGPLGPYKGPDPVVAAITNAIAAKIRREGIKPTYFIRNNLHKLSDALAQEIRRAVDDLAEKAGGYE